MSCSVVIYKDGIPYGITITKDKDFLVVEKNGAKFSVPLETVRKVLSFFL